MLRSDKIRVDTLKELLMQKALGHDVIMCTKCADKGTYTIHDTYDTDTWNCEECEVGWLYILEEWGEDLERSWGVGRCAEHKDYIGMTRPEVLCDTCWRIWFKAPKKPKDLLQNKET